MTACFPSPLPHEPRRVLTLVFPRLSTDRIARRRWGIAWRSAGGDDHPPIVFAGLRGDRMCLTALDAAAERLGLTLGHCVAEASSMFPKLDVLDEDEDADVALLKALADWCDRYAPLVHVDGRDRLSLDITGCADHHGGEQAVLDNASHRLQQMGFDVKGTVASSLRIYGSSASAVVEEVGNGHPGMRRFDRATSEVLREISRQTGPLRMSERDHGSLIRGL